MTSKQLELNFENKNPGSEAKKLEPITPTFFQDKLPKKINTDTEARTDSNKVKSIPKVREENALERIARINYEYGDSNKRPDHLDNKNIYSFEDRSKKDAKNINNKPHRYPTRATPEQFGKLAERVERQRQMSGGPSSWDLFKQTANTPEERNELKRILNKEYYKNGPKNMDPDDLKYIGKHKSQTEPIKIEIPRVSSYEALLRPKPKISEIPIEQQIKVLADKRLEREQKAWDSAHGQAGIANILRPK